jgi:hypothetical protein
MTSESRGAVRVLINAPAIIESIGQAPMTLHPNLSTVFRRVQADADTVGQRFPAMIRDLSTNGAFVAGHAMPLLARVALRFELHTYGVIDAIGWVLWQRTSDCQIPDPSGAMVTLPSGFGVLFESISLEARRAIAALAVR